MTTTKRPSNLQRTTIDPRESEDFDGKTSTDVVALAPGLRINQYELIRELGRGGMGQVFLARDTKLGRRVAMKFLTSSSPKFTERFVVEARATARCSHENIVVIHDVAELNTTPPMTGAWRSPTITSSEKSTAAIGVLNAAASAAAAPTGMSARTVSGLRRSFRAMIEARPAPIWTDGPSRPSAMPLASEIEQQRNLPITVRPLISPFRRK